MSGWWQHLPEHIDPIIFSVGFVSVHWYAVCFVLGMGMMWLWFIARQERQAWNVTREQMEDLFFYTLIFAFLGARLGYVLWYAPAFFFEHPVQIFWPFSEGGGNYIGIAGLSFHGALLGVAGGIWWWTHTHEHSFLMWMDRWMAVLPLGIIFGRLGNFLNGELWGRPTEVAWGMFFPQASTMMLRHPSQLYEMLGEGVLLFYFLSFVGRKKRRPGIITACFLLGYGFIRFILEYWREPDAQIGLIGGIFSLGQIFSLSFLMFGGIWLWSMIHPQKSRKMCYNGTACKEKKS